MTNAQAAIVMVMIAISAAVWWLWWRRWRRFGAICASEPFPQTPINIVALLLAVTYIWLSLITVVMPEAREPVTTISLSSVQAGCATRVVLAGLLCGLLWFGPRSLRDFGFTLRDWRRQVSDGLETAHASFLPVLALLLATSWWREPTEKNLLLRLLEQDVGLATLAWVLVAAVICAPLLEELLFRVILLGWLKTKTSSTHAVGISSIAFAMVHGPLDGAALMPLALLLGSLYDRRHSFLSVVVAHAFFNLWNIALTMAAR
ncbi:MAG: CPBP family intramembrane metalloprotease [Planctomycetaceae bacterium]|nr:CPBP family intramembrane metalloprotease [Planctomycetaceae bacterium]